jgi:hypothetical protein
MEPLYEDFAEFIPHQHKGRALDWRDPDLIEYQLPDDVTEHVHPIKQYRPGGEWRRFGTPRRESGADVLFHARGIRKAASKNYPPEHWYEIARMFPDSASIGTENDLHIPGTKDWRGLPLQTLMHMIASAEVVVGQSSGVMHLASLCDTRQVVWGDIKTYHHVTLDIRYKDHWNPFNTQVDWVPADNWDPEPHDVVAAILRGSVGLRPDRLLLDNMKSALASNRFMLACAYMKMVGKEDTLIATWQQHNFDGKFLEALTQFEKDFKKKQGIEDQKIGGASAWR